MNEVNKSGEAGTSLTQLHSSLYQNEECAGHIRLEVESSLPEDKLIISTAGDGGVLDSIGIVGAWDLSKGVETYLGGVDKLDLWSNLNDRLLQTCNEGLLDPASSSSNLSFFFFLDEVDLERLLVGDR